MAPEALATLAAKVSKPRSFVTLDGLRGVAALAVMNLHTGRLWRHSGIPFFFHGYLAVDFFFLLSGFVMSYVYQERLDEGWSAVEFLRVRVLRLYPLYIAGLLLGAVFAILWARFGRFQTDRMDLTIIILLGLMFLPTPPLPFLPTAANSVYQLDVPAWSLFFELVANLIHAVALRRRSLKTLGAICAVSLAILLPMAMRSGSMDFGSNRDDYARSFCRVMFGYPLGMILYRLWNAGKLRLTVPPLLVAVILLGIMALHVPSAWNLAYESFNLLFLLPLLLIMGASSQPTGSMVRVAQWMGGLSYPLYILHVPLFVFFEQAWIKLVKHQIEQDAPWSGLLFLLIVLPTAYYMGELYDPEARKLLHARLLPISSRLTRIRPRRVSL